MHTSNYDSGCHRSLSWGWPTRKHKQGGWNNRRLLGILEYVIDECQFTNCRLCIQFAFISLQRFHLFAYASHFLIQFKNQMKFFFNKGTFATFTMSVTYPVYSNLFLWTSPTPPPPKKNGRPTPLIFHVSCGSQFFPVDLVFNKLLTFSTSK